MLTGTFPGRWWLPHDAAGGVAGLLSTGYDELSLELIGSLGALTDFGRVDAYPVVHGRTTAGTAVTLVNARVTNQQFSSAAVDIPSMGLSAGSALVGEHVEAPLEPAWLRASVQLERMTAWCAPAGFGRSIVLTDESHLSEASFHYRVPPSVEAHLPGTKITIGPTQRISGDLLHEARIAIDVTAQFELEKPAAIDDIGRRLINPLIHLLVLATQQPASVVELRVTGDRTAPARWVEVVARRRPPAADERKRLYPSDALFLLPDLLEADADAMARWYSLCTRLEPALDLVSAIRASGLLQHRFLNAAFAAESLHQTLYDRQGMPQETWRRITAAAVRAAPAELAQTVANRMATLNRPSLRDRVQDLVARGGDALSGLLLDAEGLAKRASDLRNRLSHGETRGETGESIFDTTDELLLVLDFHLLTLVGFTPSQASERLRVASRSFSGLWLRRAHRREARGA